MPIITVPNNTTSVPFRLNKGSIVTVLPAANATLQYTTDDPVVAASSWSTVPTTVAVLVPSAGSAYINNTVWGRCVASGGAVTVNEGPANEKDMRALRPPFGFWSATASAAQSTTPQTYGALGDGVNDDTAAIQLAINAAGVVGGTVVFAPGTYKTTTPLTMVSGVTLYGLGGESSGVKIVNAASNIFKNTASSINFMVFDGVSMQSNVGGGHIFDWSSAGLVARIEICRCSLAQNNPAKAIIQGTSATGVFSIWFHNLSYTYAPVNTIPAINLVSPTINGVVLEEFWSTGTNAASGTYSIWMESTNAGAPSIGNIIRQGTFEVAGGGGINLLSAYQTTVDQCISYDLSVVPVKPFINIAKGASSPASSQCSVLACRSTFGTTSFPDLVIDTSVAGQSGFDVSNSTFTWVDGVSTANGAVIFGRSNNFTNTKNLQITQINQNGDLAFISTSGSSKTYMYQNGWAGQFDGSLIMYQNGAYIGHYGAAKSFNWGGTATVPLFNIFSNGRVAAAQQIHPGSANTNTLQTTYGLWQGSGVPNNANGNAGDIYFRGDTPSTTNQRIYINIAGTWTGIV